MLDYNAFDLYLIRHGQSAVNILPDQIGQDPETPLTEHGIEQARRLSARLYDYDLRPDLVYSSDYIRALDTARIVMNQRSNEIVIAQDLREYSAGDWKGGKRSQIMDSKVIMKMGYMNNAFLPPNGESMNQVERRVSRWMEDALLYNKEIMGQAQTRRDAKKPKLKIAVFSHGMTIKCLLHHIMGFDKSFTWKLTIGNTSISHLVFDEAGWRLITINDSAHLL